jgi:hypothetical protein
MEKQVNTSPLAEWESFYVIVGSSGGALTGLMFVVIALIAERGAARSLNEINAFGTPTVVHFGSALVMSAILSAPWQTPTAPSILLGLLGLAGVAYCAVVFNRARSQSGYKPVLEDWIWHTVLPFLSYGAIAVAAVRLASQTHASLLAFGSASMMLLLIGLHNAWDTVTFIVVERPIVPAHTTATPSSADTQR